MTHPYATTQLHRHLNRKPYLRQRYIAIEWTTELDQHQLLNRHPDHQYLMYLIIRYNQTHNSSQNFRLNQEHHLIAATIVSLYYCKYENVCLSVCLSV